MSDANRVALRYVEETVFKETPSGPPTFSDLRFVSESLRQESNTVASQEIRSDRQVVDLIRTGLSAAGDINFELSYGAYDDFLEAALLSAAWSSPVTVGPTTTIAVADSNTITDTANGFGSIVANQWIRTSGFATAANNGYFKVTSAAAGSLDVTPATLVAEAAGASVEVEMGAQIVNGTTFRSYAIEREFTDLPNIFTILNGMAIESLNIGVGADELITGSFGFIGALAASAAATAGDGSPTAAATNAIMNGIDHVNKMVEGSSAYSITGFNFTLSNNLRARLQVGSLGAISIGTGTVDVTGQVTAYFNDNAVLDKFLNNTVSDLSLVLVGPSGNAYVFDFPQVKYSSGQAVAGGINQDVIADLNFQAFREPTEDVTMRLQRWVV